MTNPLEILRLPAEPDHWLEIIEAEIERLEQADDGLCCFLFGRISPIILESNVVVPEFTPACDPVPMQEGG